MKTILVTLLKTSKVFSKKLPIITQFCVAQVWSRAEWTPNPEYRIHGQYHLIQVAGSVFTVNCHLLHHSHNTLTVKIINVLVTQSRS